MPGVEDVQIVSQGEVEELIEPWLGARTGEDQIPVPALVDVRLRDPVDGEKLGALRRTVRAVASGGAGRRAVKLAASGIQGDRFVAMAGYGAGRTAGRGSGCGSAAGST